jgi:hypothetical protein
MKLNVVREIYLIESCVENNKNSEKFHRCFVGKKFDIFLSAVSFLVF